MTMHKDTNNAEFDCQRLVGYTHCEGGYHDLHPVTRNPADCREYYDEFYSQSYHLPPFVGKAWTSWCAGYSTSDKQGRAHVVADLIAFDLPGCDAHSALLWMIDHNLAGFAHCTKSDTLTTPHCRLVMLLHRTVDEETYSQLWTRIVKEVLADVPNPGHANCRQRFDYPRMKAGETAMFHHDGCPVHVDVALSLVKLTPEALSAGNDGYSDALYAAAYIQAQ